MRLPALCALLLQLMLLAVAYGQRLRDDMYESIYSGGACFRRLNGTHQIGCSSTRGGSVGVLHLISDKLDVEWLLKNASAGPYAPVIPIHLFTSDVVDKLIARTDIIAGIILVNNGTNRPGGVSHDQRCPNPISQWKKSQDYCKNDAADKDVWNPLGTGLMYRDIPFPIFYLPPDRKADIQKLYDCFTKFNAFDLNGQYSRSLCAIEMNSFMFAAVNSEVCIRRSNIVKNLSSVRYCDPLSDRSIFTTLFSRGSFYEKESDYNDGYGISHENKKVDAVAESAGSIALVTAAMDATSLFEGVGFGAVTTVSGLVTMLATIRALNSMIPSSSSSKYTNNVIFVALNGETYDYIGSQRMAHDLLAGNYPYEGKDPVPPLSPSTIGPHIHLGQIHGKSNKLNAFIPNYEEEDRYKKIETFVKSMTDSSVVTNPIRGNQLPPSSVHSFLRFLNSSVTQMASVVIATHARNFDNTYYQSVLDDTDNLEYNYLNLSSSVVIDETGNVTYPDSQISSDTIQSNLAKVATSLAKSLYKHVTGNNYIGEVNASSFIIDELIHCYLETLSCPLMVASQLPSPTGSSKRTIPPPSLYVGVPGWISPVSHTTIQLAMFLSGTELKRNKTECKTEENESVYYEWVNGWNNSGICIRSSINFTQAKSPAFIDPDYDFSSGTYSTWTESVWRLMSLRIFVRPPRWIESLSLGIGISVFIIFFIITMLARRHVTWLMDSLNPDIDSVSPSPPQIRPGEC